MENLEDVMRAWFEIALEDGLSIPEPLESGDYNGRILLRTPKHVHRECVRRAHFDGVSLNQWLLEAISERLGAQVLFDRLVSSFTRTPSYVALGSHDIVTAYASMRQTITVPVISGITILGSSEIGTITEPNRPGVLGQAIWQRSGPKEEVNA
jgi:hypothetical protein